MINDSYENNIRPLLDSFDKLNSLLDREKIDIPKIVVVGDQSSGKSSVLESISGIPLPRGENTVTKCPIIIQLRESETEYGEINYKKCNGEIEEKKEICLNDIGEQIILMQESLLNEKKKTITDDPLTVKIYLKKGINLTLHDLPGLKYIDSEETKIIRNIYEKYTEPKNSIILLVLSLNTDLSTCEAISIIKNKQDFNKRTIAILTKTDLAVKNETKIMSSIDILRNNLNLEHYPILIRNRSQTEIEEGKSIEEIIKLENELMENTPQIQHYPENFKGTRKLIEILVKLQKKIISDSKYNIRDELDKRLDKLDKEKHGFPKDLNQIENKYEVFKECIKIFQENIKNNLSYSSCKELNLNENHPNNLFEELNSELINFNDVFKDKLSFFLSLNFISKVNEYISKNQGFNLPDHIDDKIVKVLINSEFNKIIVSNLNKCIKKLKDIVVKNYKREIENSFKPYNTFIDEIKNNFLPSQIKINIESLSNTLSEMIKSENDSIYTTNKYFYETACAEIFEKIKNRSNNSQPLYIFDMIFEPFVFNQSYFSNSNDLVIKTIARCTTYWHLLSKRFVEYFNLLIISKLIKYFEDNFTVEIEKKYNPYSEFGSKFIYEDSMIIEKRKINEENLKKFKEAYDEISKYI